MSRRRPDDRQKWRAALLPIVTRIHGYGTPALADLLMAVAARHRELGRHPNLAETEAIARDLLDRLQGGRA